MQATIEPSKIIKTAENQCIIPAHEVDEQSLIKPFIQDAYLEQLKTINDQYDLSELAILIKSLQACALGNPISNSQLCNIQHSEHILTAAAKNLHLLAKQTDQPETINADANFLNEVAASIKPIIMQLNNLGAKRYK